MAEFPQAIQRMLKLRQVALGEQHKAQQARLKAAQAAQSAQENTRAAALHARAENQAAEGNLASQQAGAQGGPALEPLSTDLTQGLGYPLGGKPEANIKLVADAAVKQGASPASAISAIKQIGPGGGNQPPMGANPQQFIEDAIQRARQPVTTRSSTTSQQFINVPGPGGSSTTGIVPLTSTTTQTRPGISPVEEAGLRLQGLRFSADQEAQLRQEKATADYRRDMLRLQQETENRLRHESLVREFNLNMNTQNMRAEMLLSVVDHFSTEDGVQISAGQAVAIRDALLNPKAPASGPGSLVEAMRGAVPNSQLSATALRIKNRAAKIAADRALFELERDIENYESRKNRGDISTVTDPYKMPLYVLGGVVNKPHPEDLEPASLGARWARQSREVRAAVVVDKNTNKAHIVPGGAITLSHVQDDMYFDRKFMVLKRLEDTGTIGEGRHRRGQVKNRVQNLGDAARDFVSFRVDERVMETMNADKVLGLMYWQSVGSEEGASPLERRRSKFAAHALEQLGYFRKGKGGALDPGSDNSEFDHIVQKNNKLFENYEIRAPEILAQLGNDPDVLAILDRE